jgi:hypothetical protein
LIFPPLPIWLPGLFVLFSVAFLTAPAVRLHYFARTRFIVKQFQLFPADHAKLGPYLTTFFRLWTIQNRFHWMFTFVLPRKVKRSRPMIWQILAKGGSAMATSRPAASGQTLPWPGRSYLDQEACSRESGRAALHYDPSAMRQLFFCG